MRLAAALAATVALTLAGSATPYEHPTSSPLITSAVTITMAAHGLTPGTRYAATFEALDQEDDPYPYLLGFSAQTVKANGTISFTTDIGDLTYFANQTGELYEVKMWLRPPRSVVTADPSLDAAGLPLFTEAELGY